MPDRWWYEGGVGGEMKEQKPSMTPDPVPDKLTDEEREALRRASVGKDMNQRAWIAHGFHAALAARGSASLPGEAQGRRFRYVHLHVDGPQFALRDRGFGDDVRGLTEDEEHFGIELVPETRVAELETRLSDSERRTRYWQEEAAYIEDARRAALVAALSRPERVEAVQAQVRGCDQEWIFYGGSYGRRRRKTEGYAGELLGPKFLAAEWGPHPLVLKARAEQAEARVVELERELAEAREWAASNENPAFDNGWAAGQKRANRDLRERAEEAEARLAGLEK